MTPNELLKQLRPKGKDIVLTHPSSILGNLSEAIKDALGAKGQLSLQAIKVDKSAEATTLAFTCTASLLGVSMPARAVFLLPKGKLTGFYLIASPPQGWKLSQSFPKLPSYRGAPSLLSSWINDQTLFVLSSGDQSITESGYKLKDVEFPAGLNFYVPPPARPKAIDASGLSALSDPAKLLSTTPGFFFGQILNGAKPPAIKAQGWWKSSTKIGAATVPRLGLTYITGTDQGTPELYWLAQLQLPGEEDPLTLVGQVDDAGTPTFDAHFDDLIALKGGLPVLGALTDGGLDKVLSGALSLNGASLPLVQLSALSWRPGQYLSAELCLVGSSGRPWKWNAIPGVLEVQETDVSLYVTLGSGKNVEIGFSGIAQLFGALFEVDVAPKKQVSGMLAQPTTLHLNTFISSLFGANIHFPDIEIESAGCSYSMTEKIWEVDFTAGGHIDVLGDGQVVITGLGFEVETTNGKPTHRALSGQFELGGVPIALNAEYDDGGSGWRYEGYAASNKAVSLKAVTNLLLRSFDASLPNELPDVQLFNLALQLAPHEKSFGCSADLKFTPPNFLPWFKGQVDANINLQCQTNPQTSRREVEVDIDWLVQMGETVFEADASFGSQGRSLLISWSGDTPIGLGTLRDALKLKQVFDGPEGSDWPIFQFHRFVFDYQDHPKAVTLMANSSLGDGSLTLHAGLTKTRRDFSAAWAGSKNDSHFGISTLLGALKLTDTVRLFGDAPLNIFEFNRFELSYVADPFPCLSAFGLSQHSDFEEVFFAAMKKPSWGFAVGAAFKSDTRLANVPGVSSLTAIKNMIQAVTDALAITPQYILFSTIEGAGVTLPDFALTLDESLGISRNQTVTTRPNAFGQGKMALHKGASVAARLNLKNSSNSIVRRVAEVIGIDEVDGKLTFGSGQVEVMGIIPGQVKIPGKKSPFTLSNCYFKLIQADELTAEIGGTSHFNVFHEPREIMVSLSVSETQAVANIDLTNGPPIPPPAALPGLQFDNSYDLQIGVQFEPEGMDMGFKGKFFIADPKKYYGDVTVVLEMIEEVPNPLYLSGSINQMDLWAMFELMTGAERMAEMAHQALNAVDQSAVAKATGISTVGKAADAALEFLVSQYQNLRPVLGLVKFQDVAFHWAEEPVTLPDGAVASPGVGFRGAADIFGFHAALQFELSKAGGGLSGMFMLDPIELGKVLHVRGDSKGLSVNGKQVVKPGGPILEVNSQHSPFLHGSLHVDLFNFLHTDVHADITDSGFSFELDAGAGEIADLRLGCLLQAKPFSFDAHGSFSMHLDGEIDLDLPVIGRKTIHLDAGLDGSLEIRITESSFMVSIHGSFEFEGITLHLPGLTLNVPFGDIADLAKHIWDHIRDEAAEIFHDVIDWLGDKLKEGVEEVKKIAEEGVHEVKQVWDETEHAVKEVGEQAAKAVTAAAHEMEAVAADVGKATTALVEAGEDEVKEIKQTAEKEVKAVEHAAQEFAEAAEQTVEHVTQEVEKDLAKIGDKIAGILSDAAHAVAAITDAAIKWCSQALADAERFAQGVLDDMRKAVDAIRNAAAAVWDEVKQIAEKIANAARSVVHAVGDFVSSIF
jgi:hypothetical protein